ncbi:MAG: NDP-sugar synthase [Actinobacteria bacterium]|nr:NDP-sugar synthase [Actinomycetota bacterium]
MTRAIVLVGGFGTRLRPLTNAFPKQMLPIVGRPMIEHVIEHLESHGVEEVVLSLGYRPDAFCEAYPDARHRSVRLRYAVEPEPLDTAGAIRFAARDAGIDERVIVCNGDVLTDLDVTDLVARHEAASASASIALHRVADPSAFGVVPTEPDGKVLDFVEKPPPGEAPTDAINAGTYVLEPSVIDRIDPGRRVSIERETFPELVRTGELYAFVSDTYWIDTGTPANYLQAQLDLLDGRRGAPVPGVDPGARLASGTTIQRSVISDRVEVGVDAKVIDSVVMAGATIGDGAEIVGSIIGPGARIGAGAHVGDTSVIGVDAVVDPGEFLDGIRRPEPD